MRRIIGMLAAASLLLLALAAPSFAAGVKMKAVPFTFDPDHTGIIVSAWQPHTGLADAGGADHGLVLQKNGPTPTNAAAGAVITGAEGQNVVSGPTFGWEYKTGTYCGAGAPRFNVVTSDGLTHFLGGCANSTRTVDAANPDWTQVTIDPTNPSQAFPVMSTTDTIDSVAIVFDERGQTVLDNILVNGNPPIEKPGNNS
jgi:hypothetical protein